MNMKNIEKYEKEITEYINKSGCMDCSIATVAGLRETTPCTDQECDECAKKCLKWMYSEYQEPILTEEEKDIIRSMIYVIKKIGCTVIAVRKCDVGNGDCFIRATFKNIVTGRLYLMDSPYFNNDMFERMEIGKEYTLEELEITCQTQKDNYVRQ